MRIRHAIAAALVAAAIDGTATAQTFQFPPGATIAAEETEALGSETLPTGPFHDGSIPTITVEGSVTKRAWRLVSTSSTTLQIEAPLRDQLSESGFDVVFECEDRVCGGFDFRYALDLLPEPYMHVDLGDFRYLLARKAEAGGVTIVSVVSSRSVSGGHVHVTRVTPAEEPAPPTVAAPVPSPAATSDGSSAAPDDSRQPGVPVASGSSLVDRLEADGHVVLEGLSFAVGSATLSDGDYAGLSELAAYLADTPGAVVVLVGHTDAVGSLDQNVRLSRQRAESVRRQLIGTFGVRPSQLLAEGAGFLSPRASNLTEEGRDANRRVEVVLLRRE